MSQFEAIAFEESGDYPSPQPAPHQYTDVPGWLSLEEFLKNDLGVTHKGALQRFQKYYNHYLKNFPVHYFTSSSIPGIDYALFFPVRGGKDNGSSVTQPHYLVAISENKGRTVIFHKKLTTSTKTRANFYRMTERWAQGGFAGQQFYGADINEILTVCENPEELLAAREVWFSRFLTKLERKLHKTKTDYYFKGKWDQILDFLTERDRKFLTHITQKMKSEHVNFEAAHAAASVSQRNLDVYNWIMSGEDEQAIHNRTRVTPAYPWLAVALADQDRTETKRNWRGVETIEIKGLQHAYRPVQRAIDKASPLIEALQDFLSGEDSETLLRQSTIRKTMGKRIHRDNLDPEKLGAALRIIDDYMPSVVLEEGMIETLYDIHTNAGAVFEYLKTSFGETLTHAPQEVRTQLLSKDGHKTRIKDFNDTVDYLNRVYNTVTLPYFAYRAHQAGRDGLSPAIKSYLTGAIREETFIEMEESGGRLPPILRPFGNMMVHNIVKLSVHWHNNRDRSYYARYNSINIQRDTTWPKLTDEIVAPNKVKITPHGSKSDLMEDFKLFGTCIDGYSPYCLGLQERPGMQRTYSHAFRIATENGQEKATLVVLEPYYPEGPKREITFFEIDGKRKVHETRNPPDKNSPLRLAADWYVANINNGKIPVDWDRIDAERRAANAGTIRLQAEFDVTDFEKCEGAYYALRPYLPERHRHLTYDQWIGRMGFDYDADILFGVPERDLSLRELNRLDFG